VGVVFIRGEQRVGVDGDDEQRDDEQRVGLALDAMGRRLQ